MDDGGEVRVADTLPVLKVTLARGARYLVARQTIGAVVSIGGVLALTRILGTHRYGVYAAAFGLFATWQTAVELSLDVYLVRRPQPNDKHVYDQVFVLLLVLGLFGTLLGLALLPLVARISRLPDLFAVAGSMFALLPLVHISQVPLSKLERELAYRYVGLTETVAQISFFALSLPLAVLGGGVWAPVAGFWLQQLVLVVLFFRFGRYRPGLHWDRKLVREALAFGVACTSATWSYSVRNLASPILVGRLLGARGVALVALAGKFIEQLSFLRLVTFRMSLAVLVRLRSDRAVLRRSVSDGMLIQTFIAGVPFLVFSMLSSLLVPLAFGREWAPAARLFCLVAPAFLAYIAFNLHLALLMSQPRPWVLVWVNGLNSALLWLGIAVFVPRFGLQGYGWAELLTVLSYFAMDWAYTRQADRPSYALPALWWMGLSLGIIAPITSWWLSAAPVVVACLPASRRVVVQLVRSMRHSMSPSDAAAPTQ